MISRVKQAGPKRINPVLSSDEKRKGIMDKPSSFKDKIAGWFEKVGYRRENTLLGLDIGSWAVKLVELCHTKQGWKLVNADMKKVSDSPLETLKEMLQRIKSRTDRVVSAIPSDWAIEHTLKLPGVKEKRAREDPKLGGAQIYRFPGAGCGLGLLPDGRCRRGWATFDLLGYYSKKSG